MRRREQMWHVAWVRDGRVLCLYSGSATRENAFRVATTLDLVHDDEVWMSQTRPRINATVASIKAAGGVRYAPWRVFCCLL